MQVKFIASGLLSRIGNKISNSQLDAFLLKQAKANLAERFVAFGILERYSESLELIRSRLNLKKIDSLNAREKKTHKRPALDQLPSETAMELRRLNAGDVSLYDYALKLFERNLP